MEKVIKNGNETLHFNQINAIISLACLISVQIHVKSYTVVSDMNLYSFTKFRKMAWKQNLEIQKEVFIKDGKFRKVEKKAYIILSDRKSEFLRVLKTRPILTIGVFLISEKTSPHPPEYLSNMIIPSVTEFFAVTLSQDSEGFESSADLITGKLFTIYKPLSMFPSRVLSLMVYGGTDSNNQTWKWESKEKDWKYIEKETRNLKGITLVIGLASYKQEETAMRDYWKGKSSFYWKILEEHLKFKAKIHYERVVNQTGLSTTVVYVRLLMTRADGLGVLPVLSVERVQYLDYIVTGLDSKHHLMVRTPQFVHSWQSIFRPFTPESWICLGIAICLISLTLRVVAYCLNLTKMDLSSCFLTIFGFVCCQGSATIPSRNSVRIICYTTLLFSFSIYQFYTSNFYSILSTKEVSLPFTSLEQFLAKRTHSLHIHPDIALYTEIKQTETGIFKRLRKEIIEKDTSHQLTQDKRKSAFQTVCNGKGAILGLPFQMASIDDLPCKLVPVNSGFFPKNIILVVKKKFPFKAQFKFVALRMHLAVVKSEMSTICLQYLHLPDKWVLRLLEGGISHKFNVEQMDVFRKKKTKTNVVNEPVSLEHVAFLFAFYAASIVTSCLILTFEVLVNKNLLKAKKSLSKTFL